MHVFQNFIALLTLLASVRLDDIDPTPAPMKAEATVSLGQPRLMSGKSVQLTCSFPDDPESDWKYEWSFNGTLVSSTNVYVLKNAQVHQSGNYTCRGEKKIEEWPYVMISIPSDPVDIYVHGGWILLQTPLVPIVVDETMTLTCQVRDDPVLTEVIFYKDEVELARQKHSDLVFPTVKLEDGGMYSCRAAWFNNMEYQSAQSVPSFVNVLGKLQTPEIVFLSGRRLMRSGADVSFRCITKINAKVQGLSVDYIYFKDDERLGPAAERDTFSIPQVTEDDAGGYSCKVRVRALNEEMFSNKIQLRVLPPL